MTYLRKLFHFQQYDEPQYNGTYDDYDHLHLEHGDPHNNFLM